MRVSIAATCSALIIALAAPVWAQSGPPTDDAPPPAAGVDASTAARINNPSNPDRFERDEIVQAASTFFGKTSGTVGEAVERVFRDQGQPTGYIRGEEVAGAFGAGVRYGRGTLVMKDGSQREVFWQGPSIGFDTGGNASKVFTLVYNLQNPDGLYRRYPGVEGAAFLVAGISVTYQRAEGVILAPMRTGVGLRAGVNAGYTAYSKKRRWFPL